MRLPLLFTGLTLALLAGQASAQEALPTGQPPQVQDLKPKISYVIGHSIGKRMQGDQMDLDVNLLFKGIQDGLAGSPSQFSNEDTTKILQAFEAQVKAEEPKRLAAAAEKNRKEGEAFLEANKQKPGVVTTASGLEYKVLKSGSGPSPQPTDQVTVNYKGTLLNGEQFDSSYDRGQPATFGVKEVIAGWTEALQLMKVGDKWELYIPANLAYGPRGAGAEIGPNSALIFEIELLAVQPKSWAIAAEVDLVDGWSKIDLRPTIAGERAGKTGALPPFSWTVHESGVYGMIHVLATIELAPERRSEFLKEFHAIMPSVKAETGCLEYGPAIDTPTSIPVQGAARPDVVVVIEKWASLAALEKHLAAAHMLKYREKVKHLVRDVHLQVLEPA